MTNLNVHGSCGEAREQTTPSFMRRTAKSYFKWTEEVNASESEWLFVESQTLNWKVSYLRLKWLRMTFTTQNTFQLDPSKFIPQLEDPKLLLYYGPQVLNAFMEIIGDMNFAQKSFHRWMGGREYNWMLLLKKK